MDKAVLLPPNESLKSNQMVFNFDTGEIRSFILDLDREDKVWPKDLYLELAARMTMDTRYQYLNRFPRSALFGEMLVSSYAQARFGKVSEEELYCARLLNLFITAFDSVCDEIAEELPGTLLPLKILFQSFPQLVVEKVKLERNAGGLALGLAYEIAEKLGKAIQNAPTELQHLLVKPILGAFEAQVRELSIAAASKEEAIHILENKSIGAFEVCLFIPHILRNEMAGIEHISSIAKAMGRLFGWIDDLIDWEKDNASGKKNALHLFLDCDQLSQEIIDGRQEEIQAETAQLYRELSKQLEQAGLDEMEESLRKAVQLWL